VGYTLRCSGILLHLTSLPSPYGIGTMGEAARSFLDFLKESGQSVWQLLPLGPTSYGDSPYQSFSSFAGNPYLIDLDDLARDGLLRPEEYRSLDWGEDPASVDYALMYRQRYPVLRTAVQRLFQHLPADYHDFCRKNSFWLDDYSLFMALKNAHGGASWITWPEEARLRKPTAMEQLCTQFRNEIAFWQGLQYLFFRQWNALKALAGEKGISIVGDLPIYVSMDSADVWANADQFQLDDSLTPQEVSGCPPDSFSKDGQLWGNPLFHWEYMRQDGYRWWIRRIQFQFTIYDILRIDHFRGFDMYYAIPYGAANAKKGRWRPGPGLEFFQTLERTIGRCAIIAEDLGFLTPSVRELQQNTGYPGMKVLEFAFDSRDANSGYLPHFHERNCVVYTGTHDNDTISGWAETAPPEDVAFAAEYLRPTPEEGLHWSMMCAAWGSVADLAVIQMQDLLELGSEARMNIPSTIGINWKWRMPPNCYGPELARKLQRKAQLYSRIPHGF